jgi:hypothetical protein
MEGHTVSGYTTVDVVCTGRVRDPHDETSVEPFAKTGPAEWVPLRELLRGGRASQRIDANTDTYLDPSAPLRGRVDVRDRYPLRCGECGRAVTVKADRLGPVLDVLAAHGVPSITLRGLAGRLKH